MQIRYPLLAALIAVAIWGVNVVAIKVGIAEISPTLFNALRFGLLSLLLIPFARIPKSQLKPVIWIALVMGIGHFYLLSVGMQYADSNTSVILVMLGAPISSILSFALGMERISRQQALGVIIAFSGIALPLLLNGSAELKVGALFILISMTCWAMTNILVRRLEHVPLLALQFWIGVISAPICFVGYQLSGSELSVVEQLNVRVVSSIAFTVLGSSILAYSLWYATVNQHGINKVVSITFLQPLFTMIFAYIVLNEVISGWQLTGGAITLAGIYLYYFSRRT
jgi:O-acetylserine/cysteine efflux transporter